MQSSQYLTPSPSTPQSGGNTYSPVGDYLTQVPPPHIDANMIHSYLRHCIQSKKDKQTLN
ncbi:hypothetical protein DPMN_101156 [Dreissena polymorpha]|uniref:Uncharacterized protein n=1 Tax=Dreissena polymorpha TaxID=45954 RepID=A0A9D4LH32_DREPO|nr:hypothetical protein DPMN_101156 [Dreissena polymorpha]